MTTTILAFVGVFLCGGAVGAFLIPLPKLIKDLRYEFYGLERAQEYLRQDIYNLRTEVHDCVKEFSDIINFVKERKLLEHVACGSKTQ